MLVGGVDEHGVAGLATPHDVDVVVHGPDDDPVDLDVGVLVVDDGGGALGHWEATDTMAAVRTVLGAAAASQRPKASRPPTRATARAGQTIPTITGSV